MTVSKKKVKVIIKNKKKSDIKTYRAFVVRLAALLPERSTLTVFSTLRSMLTVSWAMLSSSVPPLLCRVFCFLGGSFGSDSPRLHVTGALERELGRVERGAMVVKMRKRWEEREGEYEVSDGRRHVAMWAEGYNHFHIWKLTSALCCIVLISQKNKWFVSLVVISALLVHSLGCWFNSHLLHFNFLNYVITKNLLDSGRLSPLDSSEDVWVLEIPCPSCPSRPSCPSQLVRSQIGHYNE